MHKLTIGLVCQRYQLERQHIALHAALDRKFSVTRRFTDDGWPRSMRDLPQFEGHDAVVWFVRFRDLIRQPAFDWNGFAGRRVMYDLDAYQNFSTLVGSRYLGAWPPVYRKHGFDTLVCTGKATRDHLLECGVNAVWVPKAFDPERFHDARQPRHGACYFGELYDARDAMLRHLERSGVQVERFRSSFFDLNDHLNRYALCLICNMALEAPLGLRHLPRLATRLGAARLSPGPEPMLKNFEVAASGCVALCDDIPELADLGFRDGDTMLSYRDFDELVYKIRAHLDAPEDLRRISARAAQLCRARHTWDHRMEALAQVLCGKSEAASLAV